MRCFVAVEAEELEGGPVAEDAVYRALQVAAAVEVVACCGVECISAGQRVSEGVLPSASAITCATASRYSFPSVRLYVTSMKRSAIPPKARKRYSILPREVSRPSMMDSGVFLIVKRNPATMRPNISNSQSVSPSGDISGKDFAH